MRYALTIITAIGLLISQSTELSPIYFEDCGAKAGLSKIPFSSMSQRYVLEGMSGGVGVFDCDGDGKLDIVVVNDSSIQHAQRGGDLMVTLYHQGENLTFTDITAKAKLNRRGWGMGVAAADFDNDGRTDLYVTGYNGNALYRNTGNCEFEDVTERAGVVGGGFSTAAAWADYDRDGYVDLFVSRYVHTDVNHLPDPDSPGFIYKGLHVQGPWNMPGETDLLFHNRGDGTFEEVSRKAGVEDPDRHFGLGAVWGDYDNDGWPDLYVANDSGPNYLYRNRHDGTFEEVAMNSGVALSADGEELGSMGVDSGDFDRDGRLDIVVTNYLSQPKNLYHNQPSMAFADLAWASQVSKYALPFVGWGTGFADFDNDSLPDLFMVNGHLYPEMDKVPNGVRYREPILLFRNAGRGKFENLSSTSGINGGALQSRRGAALGDMNNDGNVDIVVFNVGAPPSLLMNRTINNNHRVLFQLVGTSSNRSAIGARVTVFSHSRSQVEEVHAGSSYLSSNDLRLHFGLSTNTTMDEVIVQWPSGHVETFKNLAADAVYTIVEGQGVKRHRLDLSRE